MLNCIFFKSTDAGQATLFTKPFSKPVTWSATAGAVMKQIDQVNYNLATPICPVYFFIVSLFANW
jgi:hypothetical protein